MFKNLIGSDFTNLNISYKDNTDLGLVAEHILNATFTGKDSSMEAIEDDDTLVSIENYFNSVKGKEDLSFVKDLGMKLADTYQYHLSILKDEVAPEVERLTEVINNSTKMYMNEMLGFENLDKDPSPVVRDFTYVDFSNLPDQLSYPEYRYQISRKYIENNKDFKIDKYNISYIFDKLTKYSDISLNDEIKENAINLINDEYKEEAKEAISTIVSSKAISKIKSSLFFNGLHERKLNGKTISNAFEFINKYPTYKELDYLLDINENNEKAFRVNMDTITDLNQLSCIILDLAKDQYKDSLVIDSQMLNKEVFEEFEKTGGMLSDIHTYLRLHHNTNENDILYLSTVHEEVPSVGIKMNNILFNIPSDREHILSLQEKIKNKVEEVKATATKLAFEHTLKDFIKDIEDNHSEMIINKSPKHFHTQALALINSATRELANNKYSNVYDNVYNFYLTLKYPNTLVSTIYEKMSSLLIQKNSTEENTNNNEVMFEVMTDIVSSFIGKNMLA